MYLDPNKYTANVYRQTTDKLMFKSVIYQQAKYIDIYFEVYALSKEWSQ